MLLDLHIKQANMAKSRKDKPYETTYENVRISAKVMERVREYCESKKMFLGGFFEFAAIEKLERETLKTNTHE